jgi:hypothetical protein
MKLPKLRIKNKELRIKNNSLSFSFGILILIFAAYFMLHASAPLALAQETQRTYTVINPQIDIKLDPGASTEGTTKVINETNVPITFNLNIQDYIVQDTHGTPTILPPNTLNKKYSAASWILVTPTTFTLKPQEKQIINYYVRVPKDGKPGGHYAAIVYSPVTKVQGGQSGGIISTQIGSLFYLTVNGPIKEQAVVSKFFANAFQEYGPVKILTQVKNLGDLHIKPEGKIKISGLFNNNSYDLPQGNIFPETARDYENTTGQWLMIGRYKAELMATYGVNNNLPLAASAYFWVFPWRIVLVIILVIIATILGYKYYKKRKKDASKATHEVKTEAAVSTETKKETTITGES